ncbi:hypothetical protein FRC06_007369 [Ceratobasidium sp. 370]|nr:hypothetical protein FRC06_007369 [Ceratobasidium sp. 370]
MPEFRPESCFRQQETETEQEWKNCAGFRLQETDSCIFLARHLYSRYKKVYFMAHKNEAFKFYKQFEAMVETQTGAKLKTVQFDNGNEYVNKEFLDYMSSCSIIHQVTSPHTPQQNGIAERLNWTLMEKCCTMIFQYGLPKLLWQEAVAYACFISNCVPTSSHKGYISPYEAFYGKRPDLTQLQTFGTPCHVLDQSGNQGKLDPKTKPATFVGIAENQGYSFRYILPGGKQVLHSWNVAFPKHAKIAETLMALGEEDWFTPTQPAIVPAAPIAPTTGPLSQRKPIVPPPAPPAVQKVEKDSKGGGEDQLNSPSSVFNKSNPANPASFLKPFAMSSPSEQQATLVCLVGSDRGSSPATEPIPDVTNIALEFVNMTAADFAGTSPDRSENNSDTSWAPSPVQSLTDYLITQDIAEFLENKADNKVSTVSPPVEWPVLPASVTEVHSRPSSPPPDYGCLSPAPPRIVRPCRRYALARPGFSIADLRRNPVHPFSIRNPCVHHQEAVYNALMSADPHHCPGPAGCRLACNFAYQGVPSGHLLNVFHTGERVENNYLWEVANMNPEVTEKEFVFQALQQAFEEQYKMPRTYDEAANNPDISPLFLATMNEEVKSWCKNQVFKIVEHTLEMLDQLVSTRWLFMPRFDQDGNVICIKARVVARGFSQQEWVNIW